MRIAICGAHAVGKTTLAEALMAGLTGYRLIPEPFEGLIDDGHIFHDPPVAEDFEAQLERSLVLGELQEDDVIFDRAPADFLAYLAVVQGDGRDEALARYWDEVVGAMQRLDLVVYVPIEPEDRMDVPPSEYPRLRRRVDRELRRLLVDDDLGISARVLEVQGPLRQRAERVLEALAVRRVGP